jgi:hypothetical protein
MPVTKKRPPPAPVRRIKRPGVVTANGRSPASPYGYHLPPHQIEFGVDVDLDDLGFETAAQRSLNPRHWQRLAENWVDGAEGLICISVRNDRRLSKKVVDGRHRVTAAQSLGYRTLKAEVHYGLSLTQEATLFMLRNQESATVQPYDQFRVGLTAGLPIYVDMDAVLVKHGLSFGNSSSQNVVGAIAGMRTICEKYSKDMLDRVFTVNELAWGRTQYTWDGVLLGGTAKFLHDHHGLVPNLDTELARSLRKKNASADVWRGDVYSAAQKGGAGGSGTGNRISAAYYLMVAAWNVGRRAPNRIQIVIK